jgi:hypothetical protein
MVIVSEPLHDTCTCEQFAATSSLENTTHVSYHRSLLPALAERTSRPVNISSPSARSTRDSVTFYGKCRESSRCPSSLAPPQDSKLSVASCRPLPLSREPPPSSPAQQRPILRILTRLIWPLPSSHVSYALHVTNLWPSNRVWPHSTEQCRLQIANT